MNKRIRKVTEDEIKNGTFVVPNGVNEIGEDAFSCCKSLSSVIIPDSVNEIGIWAFIYCKSLESVIIPDSVKKIGGGAFNYCKSLKKVSLPKDIILGHGVFYNCHPDLKIEYRD